MVTKKIPAAVLMLPVLVGTFGAKIAQGGVFIETGDAGNTIQTAQVTAGVGFLTQISGSLPTRADQDVFKIRISNPAAFSASVPETFNSLLSLYNSQGFGITLGDNIIGQNGLGAALSNTFVASLQPGDYYIAISASNMRPADFDGNRIWNTSPDNVERAPDGPGALNPFATWVGTVSNTAVGSYTINLTGVEFANQVPTPGAIALLGLGGLVASRRQRTA